MKILRKWFLDEKFEWNKNLDKQFFGEKKIQTKKIKQNKISDKKNRTRKNSNKKISDKNFLEQNENFQTSKNLNKHNFELLNKKMFEQKKFTFLNKKGDKKSSGQKRQIKKRVPRKTISKAYLHIFNTIRLIWFWTWFKCFFSEGLKCVLRVTDNICSTHCKNTVLFVHNLNVWIESFHTQIHTYVYRNQLSNVSLNKW